MDMFWNSIPAIAFVPYITRYNFIKYVAGHNRVPHEQIKFHVYGCKTVGTNRG